MTAIPAVPSEPPLTDDAALSDAALAEIESRAAAGGVASVPGPWWVGPALTADDLTYHLPVMYREPVDDEGETFDGPVCSIDYDALGFTYPHVDNRQLAEFIAAARTDVPRLVASLRSAREEITALRGWIDATDAVLVAALGHRWSPDRPPADGVKQLAEELKTATDRAEEAYNALCEIRQWDWQPVHVDHAKRTIRRVLRVLRGKTEETPVMTDPFGGPCTSRRHARPELVEPDPTRTCAACGTTWTAEVDACPNCPAVCCGNCTEVGHPYHFDGRPCVLPPACRTTVTDDPEHGTFWRCLLYDGHDGPHQWPHPLAYSAWRRVEEGTDRGE